MCNHAPNREAAMAVIDPGTPDRHGRDGTWCDPCLERLIRALNAGGIATTASCCGHGEYAGWVMLADGRELIIAPDGVNGHAIQEAMTGAGVAVGIYADV